MLVTLWDPEVAIGQSKRGRVKMETVALAQGADNVIYQIPGRPLIRGHFFPNSLASINYGQIAKHFDMLRKIA